MSDQITDIQKEEERTLAKQYAEMMNVEYVDPHPEQAPDPNLPDPNAAPAELSNEQLLELINKRSGISLSSLDDLKPLAPQPSEAEITAAAEKRKTDMHVYGLTSGKFTQAEWDSYQATLANKKDLVRTEITAQLKTAFPELEETAIAEKVATYLFEHLEETDPLRVAREKELATLSDLQIKNKFKNIVSLPKDFEQYEEGITTKANFENKVKATLPVYKSDVNRALQSLKTFTVEIPDTKNPANTVSVQLDYDDKDLKEVEDLFLTNDQIIKAVKEGVTFEQLQGQANLVLMQKHLPRLISQAAKKYNAAQKESYIAGRKGLNPGFDAIDVKDDKLTDTMDDVYDEMIASAETPVAK